ncbi:MlaD family protein [Paraconexibacter sp.]|uniref:MlaD family protein n=1 Tax=Paraconexibacter sp. TaxID=2949640 RepID=UPI00356243F6
MTRTVAFLAGLLVTAVAVTFGVAGGGGGSEPYRVAAVFDTARGLVPGQQVKVAGAPVGRVERVAVIAGPKARVEMTVERRFAPFGSDATCTILPEGLISENYVECRPGRRDRALPPTAGGLPTVPLQQTTVPTSLQDLLNAFSLPVDDRIRAIITELGLATAGRGEDLNALLRRANPALQQTQRVLDVLEAQRAQLGDAVRDTDRVLASLASGDADVRGFVRSTADLATATAAHRDQLARAVADLPSMLRTARPGLRALRTTARRTAPLLRELRASAPELGRLARQVDPFVRDGAPAVRALVSSSRAARPAVRRAGPVTRALAATATTLEKAAPALDALLSSTRDRGGFEGLLRISYSTAVSMSAYDDISHIVGLAVTAFPQCIQDPTVKACNHNYRAPGNGTIPVNNPECPAHGGATWDAPTTCTANPAAVRRAVEQARGKRRRAKARRPAPTVAQPGREPRRPTPPSTRPGPGRPNEVVPPITLPGLPKLHDVLPPVSRPGIAPLRTGTRSTSALLDYLLRP